MNSGLATIRFFLKALLVTIITVVASNWLTDHYAQWQKISTTALYPIFIAHKGITDAFFSFIATQAVECPYEHELVLAHEKIKTLEAQLGQLEAETSYYNDIQELIDFKKRYKAHKKNIAQIILKQFSSNGHFYLLDQGKNKNITKDMIAVYRNCVVGKVTEVYKNSCKLLLITDPHCKVAIKMLRSNMLGIHEGSHSTEQSKIAYVSHLAKIEPEDPVITSGEGLIFPQGFLVGTVQSFERTGLQYSISVKPALDLTKLSYCTLIERGSELLPE